MGYKGICCKLGKNIKFKRRSKHASIFTLSKKCAVNRNIISGIENGKANPSIFTLKKLADGLETSLDELLDDF